MSSRNSVSSFADLLKIQFHSVLAEGWLSVSAPTITSGKVPPASCQVHLTCCLPRCLMSNICHITISLATGLNAWRTVYHLGHIWYHVIKFLSPFFFLNLILTQLLWTLCTSCLLAAHCSLYPVFTAVLLRKRANTTHLNEQGWAAPLHCGPSLRFVLMTEVQFHMIMFPKASLISRPCMQSWIMLRTGLILLFQALTQQVVLFR